MKKNLFLGMSLLAIAGLWAGCSNDEGVDISPQGKAISFGVQGGVPEVKTKATATTTEYVNAFVVSGSDDKFKMGVDNVVTNDGTNGREQALFWNFSIARSASATSPYGYYDYNPKRYFHKDATKATFFAYSPVSKFVTHTSETDPIVANKNGALVDHLLDAFEEGVSKPYATFDYEVPELDEVKGETTQEDLLVAWTDYSIPVSPIMENTSTKIMLNFNHALSRVFITGQNATTSDVIITNLQLNNLYSSGTATITGNGLDKIAWSGTLGSRVVDIPGADANITDVTGGYRYVLAESGVALAASSKHGEAQPTDKPMLLVSKEQGMMVIPQKLSEIGTEGDEGSGNVNTEFSLRVDYKLSNLTQTDYIRLDDDFELEPGKQYLINVVFTGREINFDINVIPFETPLDNYVNWSKPVTP